VAEWDTKADRSKAAEWAEWDMKAEWGMAVAEAEGMVVEAEAEAEGITDGHCN
jgi:hypothetical protein